MTQYREGKYWVNEDDHSSNKSYTFNGLLHREDDLPAIEWKSGTKDWYKNGKLHRLDGPATILADGSKYWFIEGIEYSEKEFNRFIDLLGFI